MSEKKNSLVDFGLDLLRNLINGKSQPAAVQSSAPKKASLEDIKLDDLKREKVRLEQEERKMLADLRELETQKRKLFEDGVRNASEREQRVIARRIKELDLQAQNSDRMLQAISKQMRIINGLVQVKERSRLNAESGLTSVIQGIDLGDLITYIDKASVDGEFHMNKFDELLRVMEHADAISPQYSEDQDVLDIVKEMQLAREAADNPEVLDQRYSEMSRRIESRNTDQETPEEER